MGVIASMITSPEKFEEGMFFTCGACRAGEVHSETIINGRPPAQGRKGSMPTASQTLGPAALRERGKTELRMEPYVP